MEGNFFIFKQGELTLMSDNQTAMNRNKVIIKTSIIGIIANIFLSVFKAVIGIISNSIAVAVIVKIFLGHYVKAQGLKVNSGSRILYRYGK